MQTLILPAAFNKLIQTEFFLYGWFEWIVNPIIGILFSPLIFIKYSIICRSFEKGKIYTKKKIYLMSRTGLGYTTDRK